MLWRKLKLLCLILPILTVSCVSIKDVKTCSAKGSIASGAICTHSLTDEVEDLTFDEYLQFLIATPTKASAMCHSLEDYTEIKTELEQACRELGSRCTKEIKEKLNAQIPTPQ